MRSTTVPQEPGNGTSRGEQLEADELVTGSIPGTGFAFEPAEYDRRYGAVTAAIAAAGLDALAVTSHASLEYLTGYPVSGGYFAPFTLIVLPDHEPLYVVREYDRDAVRTQSWIEDVRGYAQERDQPQVLADALQALALDRSRLGLELGSWNLAPRDVSMLEKLLPQLQVIDATELVPSVAAIKSAVE